LLIQSPDAESTTTYQSTTKDAMHTKNCPIFFVIFVFFVVETLGLFVAEVKLGF
jgi:hypothetical protein